MEDFQPDECNQDIFNTGVFIGSIYNYPSPHVEAFVRYAAFLSGQQIDWHYSGGRGRVLVIGDTNAAIEAFHKLRLNPRNTDLIPEGTPMPKGPPSFEY